MARENADWLARRGLAARTVTLKVRYAGFVTVTRSHTLSRHTADAEVISSWAVELLSRTVGLGWTIGGMSDPWARPLRPGCACPIS